ncbi:2-nitropropane dioxygenase [Bacteroidetes bacterium UKL13-3]|jgi:nitronate monooxygenase|nr:2-nitropropane dioxygenase [Bacteroidetes bacterium UKL13-3]HCP94752.1 nitronate monooxygenase [Bacteroidota bacterium]
MKLKSQVSEQLNISMPIIMAPMFLVSNEAMMKEAIRNGISGCFPSLNYRKDGELDIILTSLNQELKVHTSGTYGVNLIVQKSNPLYEKHLATCVKHKVPFYITSLGSPKQVIEAAHAYGAKVYCDVTNIEHAKKCCNLNCDGFIAVGQGAGGHAGPNPLHILVPALKKNFPDKPVIAAGGITNGTALLSMQVLGADAVSIGTRFINSTECSVNNAYKDAITKAKMDDIVMTEKLSGTPCSIINTPAAQKMGYTQNWLERWMSKNKQTKKWFKMLIQIRGMKRLEKSVLPNNYQTLWCAGKSVELIDDVLPCAEIIENIKREYLEALEQLND